MSVPSPEWHRTPARGLTHLGTVALGAGLTRFVAGPLTDTIERLIPAMENDGTGVPRTRRWPRC
jgi:hypothetical protein